MALGTKWQTRVSSQVAVNLTNPDDPGTSSVTTARLDAAVEDVEGAFQTVGQVSYDDDDKRHVGVGILGVTAFLQSYGASSYAASVKTMTRFLERLAVLRQVTSRGRGVPVTNSPFTRTDEGANRTVVRPSFDTENFDGLIPDPPQRSADGDDSRTD